MENNVMFLFMTFMKTAHHDKIPSVLLYNLQAK